MMTTDSISDFMFGQSTDLLGDAPPDSYTFGTYFDAAMHKIAFRARLGWLTVLRPDPELNKYAAFMRAFVGRFVREVREGYGGKDALRGEAEKYVFLDELLKSGESDEVICDHREFLSLCLPVSPLLSIHPVTHTLFLFSLLLSFLRTISTPCQLQATAKPKLRNET